MQTFSKRYWDIPSALIMLGMVLFSAWRLQTAGWLEGTQQVRNMALMAFVLGLALGYSQFNMRRVWGLSLGYMLVLLPLQWLTAIEFAREQTYLGERLLILFGRLVLNLGELSAGRAMEDPLFLSILVSFPFWAASLYSGFELTRHGSFLKTTLPNGVLMFIIHITHATNRDFTWMFSIYFFLALILLGRLRYLENRQGWLKARVQISSDSSFDFSTSAIIFSLVVVLIAWSIPYIFPPSANGMQFWRTTYNEFLPSERFENLFAAIEKEPQPKPRNFQSELALGTRASQSEKPLFQVYAPQGASAYPRLYWRGQVYDYYENGEWISADGEEAYQTSAAGDLEIPDLEHRKRMTFTFDVLTNEQIMLYLPSQPVWVNRDSLLLTHRLLSETTTSKTVLDTIAMRVPTPLQQGDIYLASGMIINPTISELQKAGTNYPAWVTEKYLQLPRDFSPHIRNLAEQIAQPYNTPYDQAQAITQYLRQEITFKYIISFPEGTTDPLEYFLLEGKEGYCNYYASAQVLMLRSLGIPARLAAGYAQGDASVQNNLYVVREQDLHAWPEVYFPEYGWIEFEPTGNQNPIERPETLLEPTLAVPLPQPIRTPDMSDLLEPDIALEEFTETQNLAITRQSPLSIFFIVLGGSLFIILIIIGFKKIAPQATPVFLTRRLIERTGWEPPKWIENWLTFASGSAIERHFQSINTVLVWMKRKQAIHITPAERAWVLKHILPEAAEDIETLLQEHQTQLFTSKNGNETETRRAAKRLLLKGLKKKLKRHLLGYNYSDLQEPPPYPYE